MRSSIVAGIAAQVLQSRLTLRAQPSTQSPALQQIPAGIDFQVLAGPICAQGYLWWQVQAFGQLGYIAEAGGGTVFAQPSSPVPLPSLEPLSSAIVPWLQELSRLQGNFLPTHVWSGSGEWLALAGAPGSDSVWLYDLSAPEWRPQLLAHNEGIAALSFHPILAQLSVSSESGDAYVWQLTDGSAQGAARWQSQPLPPQEMAALAWPSHAFVQGTDSERIAHNPAGSAVATGADDGVLRIWDAQLNRTKVALQISDAPIVALDWRRDGAQLALALARPSDNLLLLDPHSHEVQAHLHLPTSGTTSLAYSPDGQLLVAGANEKLFTVWEPARRQLLLTRETQGRILSVSFSPDGRLLAVASDRHQLALYGLPQGAG